MNLAASAAASGHARLAAAATAGNINATVVAAAVLTALSGLLAARWISDRPTG
ncbi:hypothetical protein ABT297_17755 [Dactylosporangium sp. NPDC000555]|uniref:hypothetical protein n=1 Tax=Dactylosporangium sp. NPDC000555 TaxID=3154260 RepID=UPI00331CEEFA